MKDESKKKIDYFELFIIPFKYKTGIIIINLIVLILAIIILVLSKKLPPEISFLPDIYTSEAKILMPSQGNEKINKSSVTDMAYSMIFNLERGSKTNQIVIGLLTSNKVIDGILANYLLENKSKLKEDYDNGLIKKEELRNIVLKNSSFIEEQETGFLIIQYSDVSPVIAKNVVDEFLNMLSNVTNEFSFSQAIFKKRFLEERIDEVKIKYDKAKSEYISFQKKYGIISPEHEVEQLSKAISSLRTELINKESELANYRRIHRDDSETTKIEFEINNIKKEIYNLTIGTQNSSSKNNYSMSKSKISEITSEFENLKRNMNNFESIYEDLLNGLEVVKIQEKNEGLLIQILDSPEISEKKSGPSRSSLLLKVLIYSLLITIMVPIFIKFINIYFESNPEMNKKFKIFLKYLSFRKTEKRQL